MDIQEKALMNWSKDLSQYKFPRWEELPDFDLYMDQVLTLIDNYLSVFNPNNEKKIITSSMINNYVKLGLIPKPVKKRYNRKHVAYLIAISVLKQVITITEVKEGIIYQASISGIREAYDLFCTEQEYALEAVASWFGDRDKLPLMKEDTSPANVIVRNATLAVATKIVTEKMLSLVKEEQIENEKIE